MGQEYKKQIAPIKLGKGEQAIVSLLRLLPSTLAGKARFAKWLCKKIIEQQNVFVRTVQGDVLAMPDLKEPIAFHCLISGIYEPEVTQLIERLLPPAGTFLDIGANIGVFTIRASRIVGERGAVLAIEASPQIVPYLRQSIAANRISNVTVVAKAVTNIGPTTTKFWLAPQDQFGMGSMAPQFHTEPVEVEADSIDNMLNSVGVSQVHLVKIDIEGFEYAALLGAPGLIKGNLRPPIIFEFADWAEVRAGFSAGAAQRLLLENDYILYVLGNGARLSRLAAPLETGSANLLAVPRDYDLSEVGIRR